MKCQGTLRRCFTREVGTVRLSTRLSTAFWRNVGETHYSARLTQVFALDLKVHVSRTKRTSADIVCDCGGGCGCSNRRARRERDCEAVKPPKWRRICLSRSSRSYCWAMRKSTFGGVVSVYAASYLSTSWFSLFTLCGSDAIALIDTIIVDRCSLELQCRRTQNSRTQQHSSSWKRTIPLDSC